MRIASWILMLSVVLALVVGCKKEDHDQPKTKPAPKKEQEPVVKNDAPPAPGGNGVPFAKKGGGGIVANVRGSGYITQRKNELRGLAQFYSLYFNDHPNANSRKLDDFLATIQREKTLYDQVKSGYYQMNMRANLDGASIVAWERDEYTGSPAGYLCAKGNGFIDFVPAAEWKTALGK